MKSSERNAVLRPTLLVIALWAIIALPALCTAGVLAHECECGDEAVCDHEEDCDADPCSEQIIRKDETHEGPTGDAGQSALVLCPASARTMVLSTSSGITQSASPDPTPPLGVPHASDLPLLI